MNIQFFKKLSDLHKLRKEEKCSSLVPPKGIFCNTQWAWKGVKLTLKDAGGVQKCPVVRRLTVISLRVMLCYCQTWVQKRIVPLLCLVINVADWISRVFLKSYCFTWVLFMSFDKFLLVVESRNLSQADTSIIRVSSFPKKWILKSTVILANKNYLAICQNWCFGQFYHSKLCIKK